MKISSHSVCALLAADYVCDSFNLWSDYIYPALRGSSSAFGGSHAVLVLFAFLFAHRNACNRRTHAPHPHKEKTEQKHQEPAQTNNKAIFT